MMDFFLIFYISLQFVGINLTLDSGIYKVASLGFQKTCMEIPVFIS